MIKKAIIQNMKEQHLQNFLQDKENFLLEVNFKIML